MDVNIGYRQFPKYGLENCHIIREFNCRSPLVTGNGFDSELRRMRRAIGLTPIGRIQNLESDLLAVEEAARATEVAYQEVVARLRQNDRNMQESLFASSENSLHTAEHQDELHSAAAEALQTGARPKCTSDVDPVNIISQCLRDRK